MNTFCSIMVQIIYRLSSSAASDINQAPYEPEMLPVLPHHSHVAVLPIPKQGLSISSRLKLMLVRGESNYCISLLAKIPRGQRSFIFYTVLSKRAICLCCKAIYPVQYIHCMFINQNCYLNYWKCWCSKHKVGLQDVNIPKCTASSLTAIGQIRTAHQTGQYRVRPDRLSGFFLKTFPKNLGQCTLQLLLNVFISLYRRFRVLRDRR